MMHRVVVIALVSVCTFGLLTAPAQADPRTRRLRHAAVLGAGTAAALGLLAWGDARAPTACAWCAPNAMDRSLRNVWVVSNRDLASSTSDVLALGLASSVLLATASPAWQDQHAWSDVFDAVAPVAEALIATQLVTTSIKLSFRRARPRAWFATQEPVGAAPVSLGSEPYWSFLSGHTSLTFALATSSATVATLQGRRWAPVAWGVGLAAATSVGALRLAADAHWTSDVLAGAALGSAMGIFVPRAGHRHLAVVAGPRSVSLVCRF